MTEKTPETENASFEIKKKILIVHGQDIFIIKLENGLSSEEFEKNMEIAQPNINDPKLIKIWKTAFTFPKNLKDFGVEIEELLERLGGSMQLSTFLAKMKFFIEKIEEKLVT